MMIPNAISIISKRLSDWVYYIFIIMFNVAVSLSLEYFA